MFGWLAPLSDRLRQSWNKISEQVTTRISNSGTNQPAASSPETDLLVAQQNPREELGLTSPDEATAPKEWILPIIDEILESGDDFAFDDEFDRQRARLIEDTLESFGAPAKVVEINPEKTPLTADISNYLIMGKAGEVMNRIIEEME